MRNSYGIARGKSGKRRTTNTQDLAGYCLISCRIEKTGTYGNERIRADWRFMINGSQVRFLFPVPEKTKACRTLFGKPLHFRTRVSPATHSGRTHSSKRRNTSVALVPPKPKLLDITTRRSTSSIRSRMIGKHSASGSRVSILAEAAINRLSIINSE